MKNKAEVDQSTRKSPYGNTRLGTACRFATRTSSKLKRSSSQQTVIR